ncbi:ComF family protein [Pseudomonadota bacterium]
MPRIDRCVKIALDSLFPMRCIVCNMLDDSGLCRRCSASVPRVENPCRQCGSPLAVSSVGARCGRCQTSPAAYNYTIAPFAYALPLSGIVQQFKYRRRITLARPLAKILAGEIRYRNPELPDLLVPVPLHWTRLTKRGFNQSLELCRHLSSELGVPYERHLVTRNQKTVSQAELPLRWRRQNVQYAFDIRASLPTDSIAIVDDVITSGETMQHIASLLRRQGARFVQCWACLRTDFRRQFELNQLNFTTTRHE